MPDNLLWAAVEVQFQCRSCRQQAPLNHLDVDGQVKCVHCGVEQRFAVDRWQGVVAHAHAVADLAGPAAATRWPGGASLVANPYESIGHDATHAQTTADALEVRAAPGHPLCDQCHIPLTLQQLTGTQLTVGCPTCHVQRSYELPVQARGRFQSLRGVLGAEHELGRQDVKTEENPGGVVVIRCGNCSAPLQVPEKSSVTSCTYCGTACRITSEAMWRTGVKTLNAGWWWMLLEGPSAMRSQLAAPESPDDELRREIQAVAAQRGTKKKSKSGCGGVVVLGLVAALGVGGFFALRAGGFLSPGGALSGARWNGVRSPLAHDVNGDGVLDIVGSIRTVGSSDTIRLAAFDGRDGKFLWKTEVVGTYTEAGIQPLQIAGSRVMVRVDGGHLRAFDVTDGSPGFNIRLNENAEGFCAAPDADHIIVATKDKQHHTVALADGSIRKAEPAGACAPILSASEGLVARSRFDRTGPDVRSDAIKGMRVGDTVEVPAKGMLVALGSKNPGSRVPRIAAFRWLPATEKLAEIERRFQNAPAQVRGSSRRIYELEKQRAMREGSAKILWSADVPGVDPLKAKEADVGPGQVGLHGDYLVVAYEMKDSEGYRLTAFSLETGKRLWDSAIEDDRPFSGIAVTPERVFATTWSSLYAFDVKTGQPVFDIR